MKKFLIGLVVAAFVLPSVASAYHPSHSYGHNRCGYWSCGYSYPSYGYSYGMYQSSYYNYYEPRYYYPSYSRWDYYDPYWDWSPHGGVITGGYFY